MRGWRGFWHVGVVPGLVSRGFRVSPLQQEPLHGANQHTLEAVAICFRRVSPQLSLKIGALCSESRSAFSSNTTSASQVSAATGTLRLWKVFTGSEAIIAFLPLIIPTRATARGLGVQVARVGLTAAYISRVGARARAGAAPGLHAGLRAGAGRPHGDGLRERRGFAALAGLRERERIRRSTHDRARPRPWGWTWFRIQAGL